LSLRSDDLDSVSELYTENDFRQLVVTIETTPAFLGGLGKFEDHGERGLVRKTSLGSHRAVAAIPKRLSIKDDCRNSGARICRNCGVWRRFSCKFGGKA
jgi:hypothetical protein